MTEIWQETIDIIDDVATALQKSFARGKLPQTGEEWTSMAAALCICLSGQVSLTPHREVSQRARRINDMRTAMREIRQNTRRVVDTLDRQNFKPTLLDIEVCVNTLRQIVESLQICERAEI